MISGNAPGGALDVPTLLVVAVCVTAVLGLFLLLVWLQQRSVRALAWWGAAYLAGVVSLANFAGALIWLAGSRIPVLAAHDGARIALGAVVVAAYSFCIAFEFWRDRRQSLRSRVGAILVPSLHAGIFLTPLAIRIGLPEAPTQSWLVVLALQTIVYAVGTAFILMLMVKDHYVHVYRSAANTDPLTGLLNRRGFVESARGLCRRFGGQKPIALLMFDIDHFKSVNDRFGHAVGDEVLRVFAQVTNANLRASDVVARFGGEEFA